MADGSVGVKMAIRVQITKKMTPAETHALLMPVFSTTFKQQWVDSEAGEGKKLNLWCC